MSSRSKVGTGEGLRLRPHTLFILFLTGCFLLYKASVRDYTDTVSNVKDGLTAVCCSFLVFSLLQLNDGIFVKPDPALWRVMKGIGILYLLFLVFLLFQNDRDSRMIFTYVDPALGVPLPERDYASDCRVWTPESDDHPMANIYHTLRDEFVPAHFFGWLMKTLIFRDVFMCTFLSVLFEVLEYSLAHVLPNFNECWWDHWVLDVLLCNAAGIFVGMLILRYLEATEYHWAGRSKSMASEGILYRVVYQFLPAHWTTYQWDIFSSPHRWFGFLGMIVMWAFVELNCFFLKYVLWHPPPHPIVGFRLLIWFGLSLPATREYYEWVVNPKVIKIGTFAWLAFAIAGAEVLLWVKLSQNQFPNFLGHPVLILMVWAVALLLIASFTIFYFYIGKCHLKKIVVDKETKIR